MDKTHDSNLKSWVNVDANSDFPIQNIPFGVFKSKKGNAPAPIGNIAESKAGCAHHAEKPFERC